MTNKTLNFSNSKHVCYSNYVIIILRNSVLRIFTNDSRLMPLRTSFYIKTNKTLTPFHPTPHDVTQ